MEVRGENRSAQERAQDVGQQQIGHGHELISSGKMSSDVDTELSKILYCPPHL